MNQKLRERREEAGLSQEKLANIMGVSVAAICLYEQRKRLPSGAIVRGLMKVLNVDDPADIGYTLVPSEKTLPVEE